MASAAQHDDTVVDSIKQRVLFVVSFDFDRATQLQVVDYERRSKQVVGFAILCDDRRSKVRNSLNDDVKRFGP